MCQAIPSPAMAQRILDHPNLTFKMEKCFNEEEEEDSEDVRTAKKKEEGGEDEDDEPLDMEQVMANLETPLNMNKANTKLDESYFKLKMKEHFKIYTFQRKDIQTFFNLLANFVGQNIALVNREQRGQVPN